MAINTSFNGATIFKPGAYSKTNICLGGGFPLSPQGLVAIFGEADAGKPGACEIDISKNFFTGAQLADLRDKYKTGPIADAANFLFAPGADGALPSGAQAVYVYKTNASVQASLALCASNYGTVRALEYGVGGNRLSFTNTIVAEVPPVFTASGPVIDFATDIDFDIHLDGSDAVAINVGNACICNVATVVSTLQTAIDCSSLGACAITVSAACCTGPLVLTVCSATDPHQDGVGRAFELAENAIGCATWLAGKGLLTPAIAVSATENSTAIKIDNKRDLIVECDSIGGTIVMTVGFTGTGLGRVNINETNIILCEASTPVATITKKAYATILEVANEIDLVACWSASIVSPACNNISPCDLDYQLLACCNLVVNATAAIACGEPARLKKDAKLVRKFFSDSQGSELVKTGCNALATLGLPDTLTETLLASGVLGATLAAEVTAALTSFEAFRVNSVVPLFSRDAQDVVTACADDDISDGLTDSSSTYKIAGIHQSVKTHLSLMSTTKKRSERQAYLGHKNTFLLNQDQSNTDAFERIQLFIQDVQNVDVQGTIKFFQPHMLAAAAAGARGGSPIGTPLTNKNFNVSGIRHIGDQGMNTELADQVIDFDPNSDFDTAIQNGITFLENPQTGGFRLVVDNTTYGKDANFVKNRGNVQYAGDVLAFDFRTQLENIFVGVKNTVTAAEIKSVAESILNTFLAQGITVSTGDAPNGFKDLTVKLTGNEVKVDVVVKLVEGIDFILTEITLSRVTSEA